MSPFFVTVIRFAQACILLIRTPGALVCYKRQNNFFVLPCFSFGSGRDEFMNSISNNSNFLYWNLHYYHLYNFCINVSHTCIPNEELGRARNVYVYKEI